MAWMILLKKFGPYIAVVLIIFGVWMHGRSTGKNKWQGKYSTAAQEIKTLELEAVDCSAEVVILRAAIDAQNESIRIMGEQHDERVATAREVADRILANQATVYQRRLREAASETRGLRDKMRTIGVAESCHEAWLEVLR